MIRTSVRLQKQAGDITVMSLLREHWSGDLDDLAGFEQSVLHAIGEAPKSLVIDLSLTSGLGCGLISVLLLCSPLARAASSYFVLCGLTHSQYHVLETMRLSEFWMIFPSRAMAMESIRRRPPLDQAILTL